MKDFLVVVERKIVRYLRVSARSAAAARAEIESYGDQEAWSDYPCAEEIDNTRIVRCEKPNAL